MVNHNIDAGPDLFDYSNSVPASLDRGIQSRNENYDRIASELPERRRVVYARIVAAGERGMTLDELSALMRVPPNSVSGRVTELVQQGLLVRIDTRRQTRAGGFANVLVARPFATAEQFAAQQKKLKQSPSQRKDASMAVATNEQPDGLTRTSVPQDQFGARMAAGVQYFVNGKRVLCFEDDAGELFIQHCHPIGTAVIGSRPQHVLTLPSRGVRVERSDAMDVEDDEFGLEGGE